MQLSLFPAHGFVMAMWTGVLEGDDGLPRFFPSVGAALRALRSYPSWGRSAVTVYACERHGDTYVMGRRMATGAGT